MKKKEIQFGLRELFFMLRIGAMWPNNICDRIYEGIMVITILNFAIYRIIFTYSSTSDLVELVASSVLMFTWCKGLIKYFVISRNKKRIEWIYSTFQKAYTKFGLHCKSEKYHEFSTTNKYIRGFTYFYFCLTLSTALSWLCQIFVRNLTDRDRELMGIEIPNFNWTFHVDTYVPLTINYEFEFWFWVIFHWYGNIVMVIIFTGVDPTYLLMLRYLLGHFKILNLELERAASCPVHSFEQILGNCVQYHNTLFKIAKEIEIICGLDILFQCFTFIILVSFTGYLITILDLLTPQITKIYITIVWCNIQIYVITRIGNDVYHEMLRVAFCAYNSQWLKASNRDKNTIVMIILRSNQSAPLKATSFIEITNETFSKLMNSAFSYIALLQNIEQS